MIVVDSSVWIDFLNGRKAAHVERLRAALGVEEIIVGDLMLCEVLQGLGSEREASQVESLLRRFDIVPDGRPGDSGVGGPQFSILAQTRRHHSQDDRPADRNLVYREPEGAFA